jgi:antitoxin (DNA-binding transcriptional repressor) of toxin-antitoxin stability system
MTETMDNTWPVQDAETRFSELLRQVKKKPQIITYRGKPKFEVRLIKEKGAGKKKPRTLPVWWLSAPTVPEFKLPPRKREKPRKIF